MTRSAWNGRGLLGALLIVGASLMMPAVADAGCLTEYNQCEGCARGTMSDAIRNRDLLGIRQANLELWDCAIDLNHCIFFGHHHRYRCSV